MEDKEIFNESIRAYGLDNRPFEFRFIKGFKGTVSGYFDNPELAYHAIKKYWKKKTCYFTVQEIKPDIIARNPNGLQVVKKTTTDGDILNYGFIHYDFDPVRSSGIQATEDEVKKAWERAEEVMEFLFMVADFPKPIFVFSGNGCTLDYRINKPIVANDTNKGIIRDAVNAIATLYSDNDVDVDKSVFNPSRIIKLPGTISAKGSNTKDRPYRFSKIISTGDENKGVTLSQLKEIASLQKGV